MKSIFASEVLMSRVLAVCIFSSHMSVFGQPMGAEQPSFVQIEQDDEFGLIEIHSTEDSNAIKYADFLRDHPYHPFTGECLYRSQPQSDGSYLETVGAGRIFGIFINTTLYWQVTDCIDTYIADLEASGWQVILYPVEGGTPRDLRELLQLEYLQGMVGCIFIGELPAAWFEDEVGLGEGEPIDLYFRDLNGNWIDSDENGLFDRHLPGTGDLGPEIWMSRLYSCTLDFCGAGANEVELIKNYFRKNHRYRMGLITLPKRALDYIDDDYAMCRAALEYAYNDVTVVNDNQMTTGDDYKHRLREGYELIRIWAHGGGGGHRFKDLPDHATAYAHCYVYSPVSQDVQLLLGSNDGIKVWLNGVSVHTYGYCRDHNFDQDAVGVSLNTGWNRLLVKVGDDYGQYKFSARFADANGQDGQGLSYRLNNPWIQGNESQFVRAWLINGFYHNPETDWRERLSIDYLGGEADANVVAGQTQGNYTWRKIESSTDYIDLNIAYPEYENPNFGVSYAFVKVFSPVTQDVELWLGGDDGIKVWLNGENLLTENRKFVSVFTADEYKLSVTLREGWNRLLIKLCEFKGWHGFSARFSRPDGMEVEGLQYEPASEPVRYIREWLCNGWYRNTTDQVCLSDEDYLGKEDSVMPSQGETDGGNVWKAYCSPENFIDLNHDVFPRPETYANIKKEVVDIDPCCFFYDIYTCGSQLWWLTDYVDGCYIFANTYGLASWGWNNPSRAFYTAIGEGRCLGEAQLAHLLQKIPYGYNAGRHFGMYGDPTLAPGRRNPSRVLYVDHDATGSNDGASWANALNYLQDALAVVTGGEEIRVAAGVYKPDEGAGIRLGDRTASFCIQRGAVLKGGYAGCGEPDPNSRDVARYLSILTGDIAVPDNNSDDTYHVVDAKMAVLDGFTITSGNADGNNPCNCGAGIYIRRHAPTIRNCFIIANKATQSGAAVYNIYGDAMLDHCTVAENAAGLGGGIHSLGELTLTNCVVNANTAEEGGGINSQRLLRVYGSTFSDNSAKLGGAIYGRDIDDLSVIGCTFSGNHASDAGGAFYSQLTNSAVLGGCIFYKNQSAGNGGAFHCGSSSPELIDCVFEENSASRNGGGIYNYRADPIVTNCTFTGNSATWGGGMYNNTDSKPILNNCSFTTNFARGTGGGIFSRANACPKLTNCILWADAPQEVYVSDGSAIIIYSDIQGGWPGLGNIDADPLFVDPDNGDYHLKSTAGRWDPISQTWALDDVNSPCIDAGNPGCPLGEEPNEPSNTRINMGAYGGTAEASKSPANWRSIADLTNDWLVDFKDLGVFANYWLDLGQCIPSDLNRDRSVDLADFAVFAENWLR